MRIYISQCNRGKPFKKCKGNVFRIKHHNQTEAFKRDFKIAYVDVCEKCDALHLIWQEGELEKLEKTKNQGKKDNKIQEQVKESVSEPKGDSQ